MFHGSTYHNHYTSRLPLEVERDQDQAMEASAAALAVAAVVAVQWMQWMQPTHLKHQLS